MRGAPRSTERRLRAALTRHMRHSLQNLTDFFVQCQCSGMRLKARKPAFSRNHHAATEPDPNDRTGDGVLASLRAMEHITTNKLGVMLPHTKGDNNRARAASKRR